MNVLIVGASRGIGLALVTQYLERGAQVFALVRRPDNEALQQLSATYGDRLVLLSGDMTDPALIPSLNKQLQNTTLDRLIVNAGIYGPDHQDVMAINTEEIAELFSTNTVAPLRVVEGLSHCIADGGVVACMSSQMGSVTLDRAADMPLYGASKAALNSLLRSWASSHIPLSFSVLALHPGWVQTDMGGHSAPLTTTESAKGLIAVIELTRRSVGMVMACVAAFVLIYGAFGQFAPGFMRHAGMTSEELIQVLWYSFDGVFGRPMATVVSTILIFIIFGAILEFLTIDQVLVKLALAATGRVRSGPAAAATIASGLFGTISGSAVANATTSILSATRE